MCQLIVLLDRQRSMKQERERERGSKGLSCDWWRGCLWALRVYKEGRMEEREREAKVKGTIFGLSVECETTKGFDS